MAWILYSRKSLPFLDCPEDFTRPNFQPSEYEDSTGRKLPMYEMNRDGFVFLVTGFTGKEAAGIAAAQVQQAGDRPTTGVCVAHLWTRLTEAHPEV